MGCLEKRAWVNSLDYYSMTEGGDGEEADPPLACASLDAEAILSDPSAWPSIGDMPIALPVRRSSRWFAASTVNDDLREVFQEDHQYRRW